MKGSFRPNEGYFDDNNVRMHTLQVKNALLAQSILVSGTAIPIPTVPIAQRRAILLYNNSTSIIYIGGAGVTVASGYPLQQFDSLRIDIDDNVIVYAISNGSSLDLRVLEGS